MIRKLPASGALYAAVVSALVFIPSAFGQTAESKPTTTDKPVAPVASTDKSTDLTDDTVLVMDPFSVTTQVEGYRAVDTLGGARVKTKLEDTPSSLTVVTKAMMNDAGMTSALDLLVYTPSTEIGGLNGNFSGVSSRGSGVSGTAEAGRLLNPSSANRARGLTAMDNTRNYFPSEIPWDGFNISRIDLSRGPNSFLFGVGSPSGIQNYSTNEAIFKDQGEVAFRFGSFGSHRESIDYNKVLIPKQLSARVNVLNDNTEYQQKPAFNHSKRLYGSLTFEPEIFDKESSHMKIQLNGEIGKVKSNNPRELPPVDMISGYFSGDAAMKQGYDPFIYNTSNSTTGSTFASLNPWITNSDYHYAWPGPAACYWYDGETGKQLSAMTTLNGANGNTNISSQFPQTAPLYTSGYANFAKATDARFPGSFPGAAAGTVTYNDKSITDTSVFDFYNKLIDGDNKHEWQNWKSFNLNVEETMFNNRLAIQGVVDHQDFDQGQVGIYGYTTPWISVDMDAYKIMYPSSFTSLAVKNENVGRAFTAGDFNAADSSAHYVHDNYQLTLNYDLRFEDIFDKGPLTKILGHHSLTGLAGSYRTQTETRAWNGANTDAAFAALMGDTSGSLTSLRGVQWVEYLGGSMTTRSSASGMNLSNISNYIKPQSGVIKHFSNTWANSSVTKENANAAQLADVTNYAGWTNTAVNIINWEDNVDALYTSGSKVDTKLKSEAFMYQGFMLDDMIIPSFGWRRDKFSQAASNAPLDGSTALASMNYHITKTPDKTATTSTSGGITLHLPKSLRGKLPFGTDVSLYYFHGNNQTPKVRYGFDSNRLPDESGKTDDVSVEIHTLHDRVTLRLTYFKTIDKNGAAGSGAADPLGSNGYYLYLLPAWGAGSAALCGAHPSADGSGDYWDNSGSTTTEAAAVAAFKTNFAKYFPQSFFDAYGLGVNVNAITTGSWANVYNNPSATAYPWTVTNTGSGKINGSYPIVTQDITSKGFELEATVRPTNNWDVTFNASKIEAKQTALGSSTEDFIKKEYEFFNSAAGNLPLWGYWGGSVDSTPSSTLKGYFMSNIWSAYLIQKAQTGCMQPELSKWTFKGITNYTFKKGFLKGLNAGGGFRWSSKPILGYGVTLYTDSLGNQNYFQDVNKPLYGTVDQHFDAWVGYSRKLNDKIEWRVQLNLKNVGEKNHLAPASIEPDGTYAQQYIRQGMTYQVTNSFKF